MFPLGWQSPAVKRGNMKEPCAQFLVSHAEKRAGNAPGSWLSNPGKCIVLEMRDRGPNPACSHRSWAENPSSG
jgi:hypothetical protein